MGEIGTDTLVLFTNRFLYHNSIITFEESDFYCCADEEELAMQLAGMFIAFPEYFFINIILTSWEDMITQANSDMPQSYRWVNSIYAKDKDLQERIRKKVLNYVGEYNGPDFG